MVKHSAATESCVQLLDKGRMKSVHQPSLEQLV